MADARKPIRVKQSVVRSVVRTAFSRPDPALVAALTAFDVTAISDAVGRMYTMNDRIRPLSLPAIPVVGVASTAKCPPGDNLAMVKALTLVKSGDVLVVDAQGFTDWCLGGYRLLAYARERHGLAGLVVNGAYRDVAEARAAGFPVYALAVAPFSGPKFGPGEVNVPVCCGGVIVHPGDVIAASEEGVAVVPRAALADVVQALAGAPASNIAALVNDLVEIFDSDVESRSKRS